MVMLMTKTATGQWNDGASINLTNPDKRVGIGTPTLQTSAAKLLVQQTGTSAVDGIIGQLQTGTFGNGLLGIFYRRGTPALVNGQRLEERESLIQRRL